jgi:ketosteroid isomerase-like protein
MTPDHVELIRGYTELMDRDWDLDALEGLGLWAPDIVWDLSDQGLGIYEGVPAIRDFLEGWWSNWEDHHHEIREILDLGHGVVFVALWEDGRPVGSSGRVHARAGYVYEWVLGKVVRVTTYGDIDEARAAAERLAEEQQ